MTCGRGIQVRKLTCVGSDGLKRSFEDCGKEVRPKIIQTCNNQPCASWSSSAWGQVRCFLQVPTIQTVQIVSPHLDQVRIPDWYSHPNKRSFLLNYSVPCRVEKDSDLD